MTIEHTLFTEDGYISFLKRLWDSTSYSTEKSKDAIMDITPFNLRLCCKDIIEGILNCVFCEDTDMLEIDKGQCLSAHWGGSRTVIKSPLFPDIVFKIERFSDTSANMDEANHWEAIKEYPSLVKHYVPVLFLSKNRKVLVQKRVDRLLQLEDLNNPEFQGTTVPAAFCHDDPHLENFGIIGSNIVCMDYSFPYTLIYLRDKPIPFDIFARYLKIRNPRENVSKELDNLLNKNKPWLKNEDK